MPILGIPLCISRACSPVLLHDMLPYAHPWQAPPLSSIGCCPMRIHAILLISPMLIPDKLPYAHPHGMLHHAHPSHSLLCSSMLCSSIVCPPVLIPGMVLYASPWHGPYPYPGHAPPCFSMVCSHMLNSLYAPLCSSIGCSPMLIHGMVHICFINGMLPYAYP